MEKGIKRELGRKLNRRFHTGMQLLLAFCLMSVMFFAMPQTASAKYVTVDYNIYYMNQNGGSYQTAWFKGYDQSGNQLWYYQCGMHPATELDQITWIGINNGMVYFVEAGDVVALNLETGYEVWRNTDFGGSPAHQAFVFSSTGKLYLSGYYGPDLFIVDKNGRTLGRTSSIKSGYYWPYCIYFTTGNNMMIKYEGNGGSLEIDVTKYMR